MMTAPDLYCHVDIDASASRVWSVLSDLEHYRDWNPWIRQATGRLAAGATLELVVADPPTPESPSPDTADRGLELEPETLRPIIERVTPVSTLILGVTWEESDGCRTRHEFRIEPIRSGTRLHQIHSLVDRGRDDETQIFSDRAVRGIELMNAALKARSER